MKMKGKMKILIIQNQACYKSRKTISCQATGIETLSISTIMESEI